MQISCPLKLSLPVTSVSEGCDDKTPCVSKVFVTIFQHGIDHSRHHTLILKQSELTSYIYA